MKKLSREDRLRLMRFVCSFAWADLVVHEKERRFVRKLVRQLQLDAEETKLVEGWLRSPPRAEEVDPGQIPAAHRELFLDTARAMIAADGSIDIEEEENFRLLEAILKP